MKGIGTFFLVLFCVAIAVQMFEFFLYKQYRTKKKK